MAEGSTPHSNGLETLAIRRFGDRLSKAEKQLLRNAPAGEIVYCGPSQNDRDPENNSANSDHWDRERQIRADLLTWLCVDREASTRVDPRGVAVHAAKIIGKLALSFTTVPFSLFLFQCRLTDEADLTYIRIPQLYLNGSSTQSLLAEGADIRGNLLLQDILVEGEVRLIAAQIGGTLNCERSIFRNPRGKSLDANRLKVDGSIFLRDGFSAEGDVLLDGARIGSQLSCKGGRFSSLKAEGANVGDSVLLSEGFRCDDEVDLGGIQVGGSIFCEGGRFRRLILRTAVIKGVFLWDKAESVSLDLRDASLGAIEDDETSWPEKGNLFLDGLVYEHIAGGPTDAGTRLKWLDRQNTFKPQPYRQLAKVLRATGDDDGAKKVLFELERRARVENRRGLVHSPVGWLLQSGEDVISDVTVGYGIYPERAFWGLCFLTALGWIVHRRAQRIGAMAPSDQTACDKFHTEGSPPKCYPPFSPFVYSLENCIPFVKLGQDERWQPDPHPQHRVPPVAGGKFRRLVDAAFDAIVPSRSITPKVLRGFRWFMIIAGWLLATYFVAGLTGIVKTK